MKTQVMFAALAILVGGSVYAQQATVSGNQVAQPAQSGQLKYDEASNAVVEVQPATVVETRPNPIVILNNNQRLQEQPPTNVEASPLVESNADRMRKQRQSLEVNTEQKLVEKLEDSRMSDERDRADRIFGNSFVKPTPAPAPVAPPAPAPVVVAPVAEPVPVVVAPQPAAVQAVAPAPQVVEAPKEDKVDVRSEIRLAMEELNKQEKPKQTYYIGGMVGMSEYDHADNVRGTIATGLTVGTVTEDRIVIEGSLLYSEYAVDDYTQSSYPWKDLEQYGIQAAVKYQLLPGKLRPFAGAVLGYTHRTASNRDLYGQDAFGNAVTTPAPSGESTSQAFDVGVTAGVDLALSNSFSIGGEARYMTNVASKRDNGDWNNWYSTNGVTPIEELDYYNITVNGKFTF